LAKRFNCVFGYSENFRDFTIPQTLGAQLKNILFLRSSHKSLQSKGGGSAAA
jgi:hypothetical protein